MSTLNKQRFLAGFVFSLFLAIGFTLSLMVAGLSTDDSGMQIASNPAAADKGVAQKSSKKMIDLAALQVEK